MVNAKRVTVDRGGKYTYPRPSWNCPEWTTEPHNETYSGQPHGKIKWKLNNCSYIIIALGYKKSVVTGPWSVYSVSIEDAGISRYIGA